MHRLLGLRYDRRLDGASARRGGAHLPASARRAGNPISPPGNRERGRLCRPARRARLRRLEHVFGVSYGTDLALQLLRDHPEGIQGVILDSPVPPQTVAFPGLWPNARDGFRNLFHALCGAACVQQGIPEPQRTFTQLVASLEENPAQATVKDPVTGEQVRVVIDGGAANWLVSMKSFYTPQYKDVPHWIAELADSHPEDIATLRAAQVTPPGYVGYGLAYGVVCRE